MNTAKTIRARRKVLKLTQENAARELGVTLVCYRGWELGKHAPTGLYREALDRWLWEGD